MPVKVNLKGSAHQSPTQKQPLPHIQPKTVIVVGSPSPKQAFGFQFVSTTLCHPKDANTLWLVENSGLEMIYGTQPSYITDQAPTGGYGWITPPKGLIEWINSMPDRSIRYLFVYSHGVPGLVSLRYGWIEVGLPDYGLNLEDVARLSPNKFTPDATLEFNFYSTGITAPEGNLAQAVANQTMHPVKAWTGRTSYVGINRGTCKVRGSRYTLSIDAITKFWRRHQVGEAPRLKTFVPKEDAQQ